MILFPILNIVKYNYASINHVLSDKVFHIIFFQIVHTNIVINKLKELYIKILIQNFLPFGHVYKYTIPIIIRMTKPKN